MPGEHFEPCAASDCRPRVRWSRSRHFAALCSIKCVHVGKILGPSRRQFRRKDLRQRRCRPQDLASLGERRSELRLAAGSSFELPTGET